MNKQTVSAHALLVIGFIIIIIGALGFVYYSNFIAKKDTPNQVGDYGYILNGKKFPPLITGAPYVPTGLSDQAGADYLGKYSKTPVSAMR